MRWARDLRHVPNDEKIEPLVWNFVFSLSWVLRSAISPQNPSFFLGFVVPAMTTSFGPAHTGIAIDPKIHVPSFRGLRPSHSLILSKRVHVFSSSSSSSNSFIVRAVSAVSEKHSFYRFAVFSNFYLVQFLDGFVVDLKLFCELFDFSLWWIRWIVFGS